MASHRTSDTAVDLASPAHCDDQSPNDLEKSRDSSNMHTEDSEPFPRDITGWKWAVAAFTLWSSIFLYSLDGTIVAVIQATIVAKFDALDDVSWINVGFLLGSTAFNMVWVQVYSQSNSKWVYIFVLFKVGSAICSATPTMDALIVGHVLGGIGGSGLYNGAFTLISQATTISERPLYVSGTGFT